MLSVYTYIPTETTANEPSFPPLDKIQRPGSTETEASGPRVKHVSRSVSKLQGEPAVLQPAGCRLSALPPDEKCKIWNDSMLGDSSDEEIEQSKSAKLEYDW